MVILSDTRGISVHRPCIISRTRVVSTGTFHTLLALIWVIGQFGCAAPRAVQPETDPATLSDEGFEAYLAEVPHVTVDEAYRAMLILADGEDGRESFEQREAELQRRGIARAQWNLQRDDIIDTGSVAYMVCRICEIRGGVSSRLFGSWGFGDRRYAVRELVYREMVEEGVDYQFMTGSGLYTLLHKADDLMAEKGLYESAGVDLSDEGDRDAEGNLIVPE
jgi:hypothetical protein